MGHCYHHALSSVKKWGGTAEEFLPLHQWLAVMWTVNRVLLTKMVAPVVLRRGPPPAQRASGRAEQAAICG